jgi:PAS domain-containing protein
VDSSSRGFWLNELAQLLHNDVDNCLRMACADTLLAALDAVSDIVQIADGEERLVFTNTASEKVLGFAKEDTDFKERTVWDFQTPIGLAEIVLAEKEVVRQFGS